MQLTYRGISYNTVPAFTTTVTSKWTATYRGISYAVEQSNPVASPVTKPLSYRGIVMGTPKVTNQQLACPATV